MKDYSTVITAPEASAGVTPEQREREIYLREGLYVVALLRAALRGEAAPLPPEGLNWRRVFAIAKAHMVDSAVHFAVKDMPQCPPAAKEAFADAFARALKVEEAYDIERARVFAALADAGVDYLPLKGILVKEMYPRRGMRRFSDHDVLFRPRQVRAVRRVMRSLGYKSDRAGGYSAHIGFTRPPLFNFEMHHDLFNRSMMNDWAASVWDRAVRLFGHEFRLSDADFYAYGLAHLHAHFVTGGTGLKTYADLFVMRRALRLDPAEVSAALEGLGLVEFAADAEAVAERWFGDGQGTVDDDTAVFILSSGAYGTVRHKIEDRVARGGKSSFLRLVFLPFGEMKARFPFLKYLPFMLPLCWLWRLLRAPFDRKKVRDAVLTLKYSASADKKK